MDGQESLKVINPLLSKMENENQCLLLRGELLLTNLKYQTFEMDNIAVTKKLIFTADIVTDKNWAKKSKFFWAIIITNIILTIIHTQTYFRYLIK